MGYTQLTNALINGSMRGKSDRKQIVQVV